MFVPGTEWVVGSEVTLDGAVFDRFDADGMPDDMPPTDGVVVGLVVIDWEFVDRDGAFLPVAGSHRMERVTDVPPEFGREALRGGVATRVPSMLVVELSVAAAG